MTDTQERPDTDELLVTASLLLSQGEKVFSDDIILAAGEIRSLRAENVKHLNMLDRIVHALGIEDSEDDPADEIEALKANVAELQAEFLNLEMAREACSQQRNSALAQCQSLERDNTSLSAHVEQMREVVKWAARYRETDKWSSKQCLIEAVDNLDRLDKEPGHE